MPTGHWKSNDASAASTMARSNLNHRTLGARHQHLVSSGVAWTLFFPHGHLTRDIGLDWIRTAEADDAEIEWPALIESDDSNERVDINRAE